MSSCKPIGFLDSGIGGVTVLRETVKLLPNEDYVFFSDSVNNPYGDKSDSEIISRCDEIVSRLINEDNCKAIVLACNTASAKAAGELRGKYRNIPILAIEPAYKMVHDHNPDGFTLIMATKGTIASEKFRRLYYSYYNHKTAILPCIGMADLIEQGKKEELGAYLEKLLGQYRGRVQNVVLGCTHYPLAKKEIAAVLGDVNFFDGAQGISKRLYDVLNKEDLLNSSNTAGKICFTDSSDNKEEKEKRFFSLLSEDKI